MNSESCDSDEIGGEEIKYVLENAHYPNHCISSSIISIKEKDIGEWSDDHPLNKKETFLKEYERLFGSGGA